VVKYAGNNSFDAEQEIRSKNNNKKYFLGLDRELKYFNFAKSWDEFWNNYSR
jgi:hypothetical protein